MRKMGENVRKISLLIPFNINYSGHRVGTHTKISGLNKNPTFPEHTLHRYNLKVRTAPTL